MLEISFKYRDSLSRGKWNYQSCTMSSISECIKVYGLGVDCEYEILEVRDVETGYAYKKGEID